MTYIILIYVIVAIFFFVYTKIGFFHIHKNKSIADITSNSFMSTFRQVSIAIVALTTIALIIEFIYF